MLTLLQEERRACPALTRSGRRSRAPSAISSVLTRPTAPQRSAAHCCSRRSTTSVAGKSRERRISARGFVRTIFARRIILHPSSLVDMRLWALNGIVFASAYGLHRLRAFLLARPDRQRLGRRLWRACSDPLARVGSHDHGDRAPDCWLTSSPIGSATTSSTRFPRCGSSTKCTIPRRC